MRHHRVRDELIPGFAGAGIKKNFAVFSAPAALDLVNASNPDFQHQARPTGVSDHEVTAAA